MSISALINDGDNITECDTDVDEPEQVPDGLAPYLRRNPKTERMRAHNELARILFARTREHCTSEQEFATILYNEQEARWEDELFVNRRRVNLARAERLYGRFRSSEAWWKPRDAVLIQRGVALLALIRAKILPRRMVIVGQLRELEGGALPAVWVERHEYLQRARAALDEMLQDIDLFIVALNASHDRAIAQHGLSDQRKAELLVAVQKRRVCENARKKRKRQRDAAVEQQL